MIKIKYHEGAGTFTDLADAGRQFFELGVALTDPRTTEKEIEEKLMDCGINASIQDTTQHAKTST